jgi:hypothetical protein
MMTSFVMKGTNFYPFAEANFNIHETLPPGNYTVKMDQNEALYLETIDPFSLSYKIYGDTVKNTDRIMRTFVSRPNSTGVMLAGEKGSGKTLLAKSLAIACCDAGMPVIVINTNFTGEKFNTFIQGISQPCMILFDEFEKTYDRDEQPAILTLLDGVYPSKKLFVLTCNDKWRIDEHMRNRPGRIFYMIDFRGLDVKFITEYCEENLTDKSQIQSICQLSTMFAEFNFDMLKSIVEEMNRYGETAQEVIKLLNAKPQTDDSGRFTVELKINGVIVPPNKYDPSDWRGNPLSSERINVEYYGFEDGKADRCQPSLVRANKDAGQPGHAHHAQPTSMNDLTLLPTEAQDYIFTYKDLKKIDAQTGSFSYVNDQGVVLTFIREKRGDFYYAF